MSARWWMPNKNPPGKLGRSSVSGAGGGGGRCGGAGLPTASGAGGGASGGAGRGGGALGRKIIIAHRRGDRRRGESSLLLLRQLCRFRDTNSTGASSSLPRRQRRCLRPGLLSSRSDIPPTAGVNSTGAAALPSSSATEIARRRGGALGVRQRGRRGL